MCWGEYYGWPRGLYLVPDPFALMLFPFILFSDYSELRSFTPIFLILKPLNHGVNSLKLIMCQIFCITHRRTDQHSHYHQKWNTSVIYFLTFLWEKCLFMSFSWGFSSKIWVAMDSTIKSIKIVLISKINFLKSVWDGDGFGAQVPQLDKLVILNWLTSVLLFIVSIHDIT